MFKYMKENKSEIGGRLFIVYRWALFVWAALWTFLITYMLFYFIFGYYGAGFGMWLWEAFIEGVLIWQWASILLVQWLLTGNKSIVPWREWQGKNERIEG